MLRRARCAAGELGTDVPYAALADGFNFRGDKVPFLNRAYGIYRAANSQEGPAALSSIVRRSDPLSGRETPDGVLYRYQGDDPENHFNRWLGNAHLLDVPIVYFVGTRRTGTGPSTRPLSSETSQPSFASS